MENQNGAKFRIAPPAKRQTKPVIVIGTPNGLRLGMINHHTRLQHLRQGTKQYSKVNSGQYTKVDRVNSENKKNLQIELDCSTMKYFPRDKQRLI